MPQNRGSIRPYISPDTFRAAAKWILDDTEDTNLTADRIQELNHGDIIYLKTDFLLAFLTELLDLISVRFILLTNNSDYNIPTDPNNGDFHSLLDHPQLIHWFGVNVVPSFQSHPKITQVPLGIAGRQWSHGSDEVLKQTTCDHIACLKESFKDNKNRKLTLYVNFNPQTHPSRVILADSLQANGFQNVTTRKPYHEYLQELKQYRYCLCPRGTHHAGHRSAGHFGRNLLDFLMYPHKNPVFRQWL
jgi:hypothetical protein